VGEDEKGGNMKTCKCEHWEVCPVCKPEWFDRWGNRLPPEPTPLQKANGRIEELEQQLAEREKQIVLYEQALLASWPEGAIGEAFDFWDAARKLATTEPKP